MKLAAFLYSIARATNNITTFSSGNPKRITRRMGNIIKGRILHKVGFWRALWK